MAAYRLYFLNPEGHFSRVIPLECRDDEHAMETVAEHRDGDPVELWDHDRLVASFEADCAS